MCRAELLARMNSLEQRVEQSCTSHQVTLLDDMNSVAGDALESREEICSVKQAHNSKDIKCRIKKTSPRIPAICSTPYVGSSK